MNTTTTETLTTLTVTEGTTARFYAGVARNDHTVTLKPGTYTLKGLRSPEGSLTRYVASIPVLDGTPESQAYGYSFSCYPFQVERLSETGNYTFA